MIFIFYKPLNNILDVLKSDIPLTYISENNNLY